MFLGPLCVNRNTTSVEAEIIWKLAFGPSFHMVLNFKSELYTRMVRDGGDLYGSILQARARGYHQRSYGFKARRPRNSAKFHYSFQKAQNKLQNRGQQNLLQTRGQLFYFRRNPTLVPSPFHQVIVLKNQVETIALTKAPNSQKPTWGTEKPFREIFKYKKNRHNSYV